MYDPARWSIGLGRWGGVRVRLHVFFLLFAGVTLYGSWREHPPDEGARFAWLAIQALAVLLGSVLWHELAHVWAGRWHGLAVDPVVLGPLGGLTFRPAIADARAELLVHLAGPGANLALCVLALPTLVASSGSILGLLRPLAPAGVTEGGLGLVLLKITFWVNWCLFLVNLLPAYPFDGGRILQAAVRQRWPALGYGGAVFLVAAVAQITALGLLGAALVVPIAEPQPTTLPRVALVLLAVLLFFCAKRDEQRQRRTEPEAAGWDASREPGHEAHPADAAAGLDGASQPTGGDRRQQPRRQQQREREAEEERQVDEILARLHQHGIDSLSRADRQLLERVSRRYRARLGR